MRGEAKLRHAHVVDQAALHHVPAHRALQSAEDEDAEELPRVTGRNLAARGEPDERREKHETDQTAEEPVDVLPPEDALELGDRHRVIGQLVLRRLLVLLERLLPICVGERRNRADDRLPLDDRQARSGQTRDTADDDHREHERATEEEPSRDRSRRGAFACAGEARTASAAMAHFAMRNDRPLTLGPLGLGSTDGGETVQADDHAARSSLSALRKVNLAVAAYVSIGAEQPPRSSAQKCGGGIE